MLTTSSVAAFNRQHHSQTLTRPLPVVCKQCFVVGENMQWSWLSGTTYFSFFFLLFGEKAQGMQERMGVRHSSSLASPFITVIRGHLAWKAPKHPAEQQRRDNTLPEHLNALWLERALSLSFALYSE